MMEKEKKIGIEGSTCTTCVFQFDCKANNTEAYGIGCHEYFEIPKELWLQKKVCPNCGKSLFLWSDGANHEFGECCDFCGYHAVDGVVLSRKALDYTLEGKEHNEKAIITRCQICNEPFKTKRLEFIVMSEQHPAGMRHLYDKQLCEKCLTLEIERLQKEGIISLSPSICKSCSNDGFTTCRVRDINDVENAEKEQECDDYDWDGTCSFCHSNDVKDITEQMINAPDYSDEIDYFYCNACKKNFEFHYD